MGSAQPAVWMTPFIIAGVACFAGAIIMLLTTSPGKKQGPSQEDLVELRPAPANAS